MSAACRARMALTGRAAKTMPTCATWLPTWLRRQRAIGIDIINEGEYTKGGDWLSYVDDRFDGFEVRPPAGGTPIILQGKDREVFADFYRYATERGTLFYAGQIKRSRPHWIATGPVSYRGEASVKREIEIFRNVVGPDTEAFITTTAPASLEPYRRNEYYLSQEEFVFALAEAMRREYQAIVAAGFILQIDDAWLPALWDRIGIDMGLPAFRKYCEMRIEALNHALGGPHPLSSVLGQLARPPCLRYRARQACRSDAAGAGARLPDRGRERTA
jgi:5-methyltetrahydropteroyltriglutamate--homocysteine methyltransferase